jgi:hypothetical protein
MLGMQSNDCMLSTAGGRSWRTARDWTVRKEVRAERVDRAL